ncbi:MAG: hypothetical protein ACD_78C00425G0003 [uncultured bacterium (gcode 4)]|uniref:Uncharacterized protein n=1 Tax=uncultured bacterium (gcode 4) TaxID=1234023 RepID=K1XVW2_9BACT|nr:MAG: hypothetical protein ACD_78C00425G0003 [uncultured bacterium (gcode 4)]
MYEYTKYEKYVKRFWKIYIFTILFFISEYYIQVFLLFLTIFPYPPET